MNKAVATWLAVALLLIGIGAAAFQWYVSRGATRAAENTASLKRGISLYEQERYGEALRVLEEIPAGETGDWRIPYYVGSAHIMLQQYAPAVAALEQALALENGQTGILYALGVAHYKLGHLGLAKGYFAAVLELDPADQHAKGLMDIMADLERQQSGGQEEEGRSAAEPES